MSKAPEAVAYIASLPLSSAASSLRLFGHDLMSVAPGPTTDLITALCTTYTPGAAPDLGLDVGEGRGEGGGEGGGA